MKNWKLQVLVATIVALLFGFASQSIATSYQSSSAAENGDKTIAKRSFGDWEYQAQQVGPNTYVRISSSLKGKAALKALLAKHKQQLPELFQSTNEVTAILIPVIPLSFEQFTDLVRQHGIKVETYAILSRTQNGELNTIFGAPKGDVLIPEQELAMTMKSVEENQHTVLQVQGIVAVQVKVSNRAFQSLDKDPAVLGLDLTPALAMQDLAQQQHAIDTSKVQLTPSSLYWINVEE